MQVEEGNRLSIWSHIVMGNSPLRTINNQKETIEIEDYETFPLPDLKLSTKDTTF